MPDVDVVIIGGGYAGISVAYQLSLLGISNIVIEAGQAGRGSDDFLSCTNTIAMSKIVTSFGDIIEVCRILGKKAGPLFAKFLSEGVGIQRELSGGSPEILKSNGVHTNYEYDIKGRLTNLKTTRDNNGVTETLQDVDYTAK